MPHLYFISGLGADSRLFHALQLQDYDCTFLDYMLPLPGEHIGGYALRMSREINTSEPFVLIGVSFGGILAMEIAKHVQPWKIFLISSIKIGSEQPFFYRVIRFFRLQRLIKPPVQKRLAKYFLTLLLGNMPESEKKLCMDMMHKSDNTFIGWAEEEILNWKNDREFENIVRIHGTKDVLFPVRYIDTSDALLIKGGTHYMIVRKASEINSIIMFTLATWQERK